VFLPFGLGTAALDVVQAATVALPRGEAPRALQRLSGRGWALIAPASIVAVVFGIQAVSDLADGLTWLAIVAVPPLAAAALGAAAHGARPAAAPLAAALLLVAWLAKDTFGGDLAATALTALSCVTLGWLLAAVTPAWPLKAGVVVMAAIDAYLIWADELQGPSATLKAAAPALDLPRLQYATLADASIGYGDLFVAGVFGAVVAAERRNQAGAALLVLVLALAFDLLFWVADTLPATVPVAVALLLMELRRR
jgi:hypothetical protein